jgi:GR25 family glycosyltransferase involved in LPS biosynthesis|tara:strand:- start:6423 stop:7157 length:735 start_codon:yes stop_codon:yes gene_type:complete
VLNTEKVYVVHYTRLIERRQKLEGFFRNNNIKPDYIHEYDKETLTSETLEEYYLFEQKAYEERVDTVYGSNTSPFRPMSRAEISCTIKHYHAIKKLGEECVEHGLILEDDVVFCDNFVGRFNSYLKKTPDDWDAIFMGSCCELETSSYEQRSEEQIAFHKEHPASKCADAYLLRAELAQKISTTMKPFVVISDWELACQLAEHDAKVYWWEPALIHQGSESGLFNTTLGCLKCGVRGCLEHEEN